VEFFGYFNGSLTMIRLSILLVLLGMACQTSPVVCPPPEVVKLKKAKAHRLRYLAAMRKEAQANNHDYFQESRYKTKELRKIEEWDCPKPGLKHDKMVQKKARDLQKRYVQDQKRVAKESEERTVTVNSNRQQ